VGFSSGDPTTKATLSPGMRSERSRGENRDRPRRFFASKRFELAGQLALRERSSIDEGSGIGAELLGGSRLRGESGHAEVSTC